MKNEELVLDNMKLVYYIAKKYLNTGYEYDDLIQEGAIGLMKAAERFDSAWGCRFSTLAGTCIENSIRMYLRNQKKHKRCVLSLDQEITEGGARLGDIVGFQESFDNLFLMESLKQAVSVLDRNGLELIRGYYLDGVTQKELAEQYGVNQPEISKKLKRLLLKMRRAAE